MVHMIRVSMGQQHLHRHSGDGTGIRIQLRRVHRQVDQCCPFFSDDKIRILRCLSRSVRKAIFIRSVQSIRDTKNSLRYLCME